MSKDAIRREVRERLKKLSADDREKAAEVISRRVWTIPEIAHARTLLLYASMREEVTTDAIATEAIRRGITITYPRCLPETRTMTLHALSELSELREGGSYGIREPDIACPRLELREIDAALVPGLAWDRLGGRLGRGAGYYDRLFADSDWRGFRCGLFFATQEVDAIPTDPWDVGLDAVTTEREVRRMVDGEL